MNEKEKTVVKTMSIADREYKRSLINLYPELAGEFNFSFIQIRLGSDEHARVKHENAGGNKPAKYIELHFDPMEPHTFGGLLNLPQAQITIKFHGLSDAETANFMDRFDRAFQRGGG